MDEKNPLNELSETLRPAVEQVRAVAPPDEAVARSQERAQQMGPPLSRRPRRWLGYCAAAGIAAAVFVAFGLWPDPLRKHSVQIASNQRAIKGNDIASFPHARGQFRDIDATKRSFAVKEDFRTPILPPIRDSDLGPHPKTRSRSGEQGETYTKNEEPLKAMNNLDEALANKAEAVARSNATDAELQSRNRRQQPDEKVNLNQPSEPSSPYINILRGGSAPAPYFKNIVIPSGNIPGGMMGMGGMSMMGGGMMGMGGMGINGGMMGMGGGIPSQQMMNPSPKENQPLVWHRDRSRPTFARVYVGDNNALELVSLHVSVTIEGPRARTVVDHIFRNPHDRQLEGTFEYPLPTGASPSYFGMFLGQTRPTVPARFARRGDNAPLPAEALANMTPTELVKHVDTADWGRLQEGRIVSKEKALETYEEVVRGRIDPALLEYTGGNTFSGRVFPISAKGYNRVILAYEELLPFAQEQMIYRFTLPNRKLQEMQFSLQASAAECLHPSLTFPEANRPRKLPGVGPSPGSLRGRFAFAHTWKDTIPAGDILFSCTPANPAVQSISGRQGDNGPRYVYVRLRPSLKAMPQNKPFASQAVFLLDTSLSEHPERFAVNVKLLQKILENDRDIKQFNILTFNVGAAWLDAKGWFANTVAGREQALKKLDGIVLEGATDLACALDKLAAPGFDLAAGTPLNVFVLSDGHITWGEPDVAALVARFERDCPFSTRFHCYRTGLGEENSELFEALTRKGGGVFQCYGEAELQAAAKAHRGQCLQVKRVRFVGGPQASDILVSGRRAAVYPDGELVVAARFGGIGRTTLIVEGEYAGKEIVQEFPLEVKSGSELAPRAWAEIAVASLLALHDSNFDALVTAYCQQFGIVSRVASFLVLENEADYKRFNLEEERGKTVAGDLGDFVGEMWARLGKRVSALKEFERFLTQVNRRAHLLDGPQGAHVKQMLAVLTEEDYELPAGSLRGGLIHAKDVAAYLAERERERSDVGVYLKEAGRRAESGDVEGAVRVLSSIIEEHPGRSDALRLVGYRLLDMEQAGQAARLFAQVQKQRPFEPHSYRDLAHALEQSGRYAWAALNYEAVLAGTWHNRFREELKLVAQEEYAHMMQEAIRTKKIGDKVAHLFGERLEQMARPQPKSDLRVTISWNTDATDVDLWVIEPDGTKCFYQHNRTHNGGELSQDQTQGYGPERYQIAHAQPGVYTVIVHYFGVNRNLLGGETHVRVNATRFAGTPQEKMERHTIILKKHGEQVEVCKIKF